MSPWLQHLATNAAVALGATLLVLLAERFVRPRPAVMHGLWMFVLAQLCWPVRLPVPVLPSPPSPPVTVELGPLLAGAANGLAATTAAAPSIEPDVGIATAVAAPAALASVTWLHLHLLATATAALVLLAVIWRGSRRLRRLAPAPPWLADEVATLAARIGLRPPRVFDQPDAATPFVWPFGRPAVVVGVERLQAMPTAARAAVLLHELAHLRRGDPWWLGAELAIGALQFWNPLFWFVAGRARTQRELACDAWVIAELPAARFAYARALVQALATQHPAPLQPVLASRPAARRQFERRLSMIVEQSVPCRLSRWASAGAAALCLLASVVPVRGQERPRPQVEIRVDGVRIDRIDDAQRERLLRQLGLEGEALRIALQARAAESSDEAPKERKPAAPRQPAKPHRRAAPIREAEAAPEPESGDWRSLVATALAEAKSELESDADLRELGLTTAVTDLVDTIGKGGDFGEALDRVIGDAMQAATKLAQKEIAADPELRELGIADGLGKLLAQIGDSDELQRGAMALAKQAAQSAIGEARREIADDPDLKELGIADDLDRLLVDLGDLHIDLDAIEPMVQKAMRGALRQLGDEAGEAQQEAPQKAQQKRARKQPAEEATEDKAPRRARDRRR